jgi:hypothetical protein
MSSWKKISIRPSSSVRCNKPEFIWRKKEKLGTATAVQAVQFIGGVITWSKFM